MDRLIDVVIAAFIAGIVNIAGMAFWAGGINARVRTLEEWKKVKEGF